MLFVRNWMVHHQKRLSISFLIAGIFTNGTTVRTVILNMFLSMNVVSTFGDHVKCVPATIMLFQTSEPFEQQVGGRKTVTVVVVVVFSRSFFAVDILLLISQSSSI